MARESSSLVKAAVGIALPAVAVFVVSGRVNGLVNGLVNVL
jgi:uncharacterized membrane protein YqaE (UPF0057 family)